MSRRHVPSAPSVRLLADPPTVRLDPPAGLSARQRRRWEELWASPLAVLWDAALVTPLVVEMLRLEGGDGPSSRELEHVSRLRKALYIEPDARRRAGVALASDPWAPRTAVPAPGRPSAPSADAEALAARRAARRTIATQ